MADRVLELALEALEARRSAVDAEIARIRRQLGSGASAARRGRPPAAPAAGGRRRQRRSAASRRAQSLKMKAYWAKRRAQKK